MKAAAKPEACPRFIMLTAAVLSGRCPLVLAFGGLLPRCRRTMACGGKVWFTIRDAKIVREAHFA